MISSSGVGELRSQCGCSILRYMKKTIWYLPRCNMLALYTEFDNGDVSFEIDGRCVPILHRPEHYGPGEMLFIDLL